MKGNYSVWYHEVGSKQLTLVAQNMTRRQRLRQIYMTKNMLKSMQKSATVITYVGETFHSAF